MNRNILIFALFVVAALLLFAIVVAADRHLYPTLPEVITTRQSNP